MSVAMHGKITRTETHVCWPRVRAGTSVSACRRMKLALSSRLMHHTEWSLTIILFGEIFTTNQATNNNNQKKEKI